MSCVQSWNESLSLDPALYQGMIFLYNEYNTDVRIFDFISYLSYQLHCCALPDKCCLSHGMLPLSGHDDVALFEWRR